MAPAGGAERLPAADTARTFDDVLAEIFESKTTVEQGTRFENLMLDVFREDRLYKNRFDRVWTWKEWAQENNIKESHDTEHDLGVDLVGRERVGGELCAIQCKCHSDDTILEMRPVSSFISAGTAYGMKNYILACTGPINRNARAKLRGVKCGIITKDDLRYRLDWSAYPRVSRPPPPKKLRDYQRAALDDVVSGFAGGGNERGKLIMACGTGKTLVALHAAEKIAGGGGLVLYLVPSISLILQSMREWSDNANMRHYYMAVCSDKSVRNTEQGTMTELEAPASTNTKDLAEKLSRMQPDALNVIFSTYHSIDVVSKAVGRKRRFDMVFCDEAHRTAGIERDDSAGSYYTKVHRERSIRAKRRLYMTATPRIYTENAKGRAADEKKTVVSMDDDSVYGPVFHELSFYDAVHKYEALCDFKVRVAIMDEDTMDRLAQELHAGEENEVPVNERSLMASVWHAIQHPGADDEKKSLLQRVIFFCDMINSSKIIAGDEIKYNVDYKEDPEELELAKAVDSQRSFERLVKHINDAFREPSGGSNAVDVRHVDGADNAEMRKNRLEWLKNSSDDPRTCRILSNARCLSEGVDVPALDGVVFLNPRKSVVDVVQAVGRVMRKAPGKEYGYVILPVVIPMGMGIDDALSDSKHFKVVWQVLNALRSHDLRLENEINTLALDITKSNNEVTNRIIIRHAYSHDLDDSGMPPARLINAISSTLVRKVGDVAYYDKYAKNLGAKAREIKEQIKNRMDQPRVRDEVRRLQDGLRFLINGSITADDAVSVIAQHMVLSRIFDMLFRGEFKSHNPVSATLGDVVGRLRLDAELREFEGFYAEAEREIDGITTREARQNFIRKIYDNFFKGYAKKETEQLGIVYTPVEIIDFILNSVQHVLRTEFGTDFADRNVKVLDPFAGMGTFLTRLMELGLLGDNMYEKYKHDMYSNEIMLLAYYVATVNMETTYSSLRRGGRHVPFDGMSYTDTLMLDPRYRQEARHRQEETKIDAVFERVHERVRRQRGSHLHVIVGNPPYSAGQDNYNDQNQNMKYPEIDKRVDDTYSHRLKQIDPTLGAKNSMSDSYIRSIRWASDRIGESGIIGVVTNASFIRTPASAGVRACLREEFTDVWVFDLLGKKGVEGHGRNIFEYPGTSSGGTTTQIAIIILVKNPTKKEHTIHYTSLTKEDYSGPQKRMRVKELGSIAGISDWQIKQPDKHHDWLGQRSGEFDKYLPMGSKDAKKGKENALFRNYWIGVATSRDVWAYNSSKAELAKNMQKHIEYCNLQDPENPIINSKKAKWSRELSNRLQKSRKQKLDKNKIRISLYRPFFKQYLYLDKIFTYLPAIAHNVFPKNDSKNLTIVIPDKGVGEKFSGLMSDVTPDLHVIEQSQVFPLKTKGAYLERERERERERESNRNSNRNLCIIVPHKIEGEFSVFITDTTPDLEVIHHGQVFPMRVMEK